MTEEENKARDTLKALIDEIEHQIVPNTIYYTTEQSEKIEALKVAIDKLEEEDREARFRTPKKVNFRLNESGDSPRIEGICPRCHNPEGLYDDQKFCDNCGQALDWSETTPEKLKEQFLDIEKEYEGSPEDVHFMMDRAMCDLLMERGYGEAVEIFWNAEKWYS